MTHAVYPVPRHRKNELLVHLLTAHPHDSVLVFTRTKSGADRVVSDLKRAGIQAGAMHADKSQKDRLQALEDFKRGTLRVLVATDVAARGIDIDDVAAVVHYEPPIDVKTYLHRSGRTARAGRDGWAVTLAEYNQHTTCRIIQRALRLPTVAPIEVFSNDARLRDLRKFLAE